MKRIVLYLFIAESWILGRAPKFILYGIADIVFFFLYFVTKYRKKVVFKNLKNAFPEKSFYLIRVLTLWLLFLMRLRRENRICLPGKRL